MLVEHVVQVFIDSQEHVCTYTYVRLYDQYPGLENQTYDQRYNMLRTMAMGLYNISKKKQNNAFYCFVYEKSGSTELPISPLSAGWQLFAL